MVSSGLDGHGCAARKKPLLIRRERSLHVAAMSAQRLAQLGTVEDGEVCSRAREW